MKEMTKRELIFTLATTGAAIVAAMVLANHMSAVLETYLIAGFLAAGTLIGSGTSMLMHHWSAKRQRKMGEV